MDKAEFNRIQKLRVYNPSDAQPMIIDDHLYIAITTKLRHGGPDAMTTVFDLNNGTFAQTQVSGLISSDGVCVF